MDGERGMVRCIEHFQPTLKELGNVVKRASKQRRFASLCRLRYAQVLKLFVEFFFDGLLSQKFSSKFPSVWLFWYWRMAGMEQVREEVRGEQGVTGYRCHTDRLFQPVMLAMSDANIPLLY